MFSQNYVEQRKKNQLRIMSNDITVKSVWMFLEPWMFVAWLFVSGHYSLFIWREMKRIKYWNYLKHIILYVGKNSQCECLTYHHFKSISSSEIHFPSFITVSLYVMCIFILLNPVSLSLPSILWLWNLPALIIFSFNTCLSKWQERNRKILSLHVYYQYF